MVWFLSECECDSLGTVPANAAANFADNAEQDNDEERDENDLGNQSVHYNFTRGSFPQSAEDVEQIVDYISKNKRIPVVLLKNLTVIIENYPSWYVAISDSISIKNYD